MDYVCPLQLGLEYLVNGPGRIWDELIQLAVCSLEKLSCLVKSRLSWSTCMAGSLFGV